MEKPLTEHIRAGQPPLSLKDYERVGGYAALSKVLKGMPPESVTQLVKDSNLRGRGGAGFSTGLKWSFVPLDAPKPKYLIANADEMEPGTFKDRMLLENTPHQLIEGMVLTAYAIQANESFVFLRWAYKAAASAITTAIQEAYQAGYLGNNILGSGFDLNMHLHIGVGRYMCGEETALLNSLEGKRAIPRAKPPFPQVSGLFGRPTIVNNVETLCNIPHIVNNGAEWFRQLSRTGDAGTKLYGVSGKVKKPGAWELPMGTTMRELIEEHAGGMQDGLKFRGALPGGASTDFLVADHLDVPMDYTSVAAAGSRLGTGTLIVLDDKTCPVGFVENLEHFFAQESCGFCTPCREGLPWVEKILASIDAGQGREKDLELLEYHTRGLAPGHTFCALAPGAMEPLQSALKYFREDFETHIKEHRCPY
ncbi:MAG: NADH-quinone oxidoreductase subunit NuoF [Cyclobacteriaceae bacterium]|nr:NADH-quinone oxidoreductase subunit NuoF [Cyclobacteriaceae bacterium]MCB0500601.1 NADH-quinone oxidoreductase subunit NuoF [Cyclobacteriaceae bacterium]MCB9237444.1 NADH-quinone oxidoreductase subunit NuoF [Flammeovirgaceae bacterium]MCO5273113.1 NADH-quinone oxidoreductase subunit NuoF [Cyclobacteriaceae bacterium]MCW5903729.1 NADH-quinone oxidoreductase subunit NuoF [Cyclobacteriaceae bacterium]